LFGRFYCVSFYSPFVFFFIGLVGSAAHPDVLVLDNGDRVTGEIVGLKNDTLNFKSNQAGSLKVSLKNIGGLLTDQVVTIRYKSGGYSTGRLTSSNRGTLRMESTQGRHKGAIQIFTISEIHPGSKIPRGFDWTGRINAGATQRSGNTDTRLYHLDASIKGRAGKDRHHFEGSFNKEFSKGERTQDDFTVFVQHDRYNSKSLYFYTNVKLARNEPQELTLRTTLGTGGGWQVIEDKKTNLSVKTGPAYVNKNFKTASDDDSLAG